MNNISFLLKNLKYKSLKNLFLNQRISCFCNKTLKGDPHSFPIYKKVKPSLGKNPPLEPMPSIYHNIQPAPEGYSLPINTMNPYRFALENNYPIIRESVSSSYRIHINGITYHVFNGARYVSKFLTLITLC